MDNPFPRPKPQPELEKAIQKRITKALQSEGWFAKWTHGNKFQSGVPDVYAHHRVYGPRWIEVKKPKGSRLEDTQYEVFAAWEERRVGVWVLTDADLGLLLRPPNWRTFDTGRVVTTRRVERLPSGGPEREIQEAIKARLREGGWHCVDLYGHTFSHGFPDLYACHRDWGSRWIEVKARAAFTPSQVRVFREMAAAGCGIWVLHSADVTPLFRRPNLDEFSSQLSPPRNPLRP
jgi:hypothetical protein